MKLGILVAVATLMLTSAVAKADPLCILVTGIRKVTAPACTGCQMLDPGFHHSLPLIGVYSIPRASEIPETMFLLNPLSPDFARNIATATRAWALGLALCLDNAKWSATQEVEDGQFFSTRE
jgi:hypothetical protein